MTRPLDWDRALVVGAGSPIGAAIVRALLMAGRSVGAVDRAEPTYPTLNDAEAGRCLAFAADVSDEREVARVIAELIADAPVQHLFNVATVGSTATVPDTRVEVWDQVFAVNVRGTYLMCKHVIPEMIVCGGGSVVNVASVAGLVGMRRSAAHSAACGAVIALTRAMALDHAQAGVRINCVCPGAIATPSPQHAAQRRVAADASEPRYPIARLETPEEIAAAALYLASDDADGLTGITLTAGEPAVAA